MKKIKEIKVRNETYLTGLQKIEQGSNGNYITTAITPPDSNGVQTVGSVLTIQNIATADNNNKGLAEASDVKSYVNSRIDSCLKQISNLNAYKGTDGEIIEYIGTTDNNFVNGYIYKSVVSQVKIADSGSDIWGLDTNITNSAITNEQKGKIVGIWTSGEGPKVRFNDYNGIICDVVNPIQIGKHVIITQPKGSNNSYLLPYSSNNPKRCFESKVITDIQSFDIHTLSNDSYVDDYDWYTVYLDDGTDILAWVHSGDSLDSITSDYINFGLENSGHPTAFGGSTTNTSDALNNVLFRSQYTVEGVELISVESGEPIFCFYPEGTSRDKAECILLGDFTNGCTLYAVQYNEYKYIYQSNEDIYKNETSWQRIDVQPQTEATLSNSYAKANEYTEPSVNDSIDTAVGKLTKGIDVAKNLSNATDTLSIAHGGTGATTAKEAEYNILSGHDIDTNTPTDGSILMFCRSTSANHESGIILLRSCLKLWNYILTKITGAISEIVNTNLAASSFCKTDANGKIVASSRTNTVATLMTDNVSTPTHFLTATTGFTTAGYTSVANVKTALGIDNKVENLGGVSGIIALTQAQYDALATKDNNTMYVITD